MSSSAHSPNDMAWALMRIMFSMSVLPMSIDMPRSSDTLNRITGVKAMPPRRGTVPRWILRSSGMSNSLRRYDTRRICGISIPAKRTLSSVDRKQQIIQVVIYRSE